MLILVVAVLVLLVLVGTAYIQAARNDRAATETMNNSNIDLAVNAEIARVAALLKADLIDPGNGDMLDGGGADEFVSREPYDFPDKDIDPWLAPNAPEDDGSGNPEWRNVSNVTGDPWASGNETLTLDDAPDLDQNITVDSSVADADGDGITDSRWVDSAIGSVRGTRYVAAVRVIDLSGLLNINVATALTDGNGEFTAVTNADAPRWFYPTELDLNRFLVEVGSPGADEADRRDFFEYRLGESPINLPTPWDRSGASADSRFFFWRFGPRLYGNFNAGSAGTTDYVPLGMPEELKLRHANGLNSPEQLGTAIDEFMPDYFRERPSDDEEGDYRDVPGVSANQFEDYFADEPRHQLTAVSGASIVAPKFGGGAARTLQVDLNNQSDADIAEAIAETYDGATQFVPAGGFNIDEFAAQLAASIRDYRDADNRVTRVTFGTATNRLGFEALPYIAEVYAQSVYEIADAGDITGTAPNIVARWTKKSSTDGYAIEIRNPFNQEISIENIRLHVGGNSSDLSTLAGKTTMDAGEVLLLHRNNDGGGGGATDNDIPAMAQNSPTTQGVSFDWPTDASFDVKLTAEFDDGSEWTSGYVVFPSGGMPGTINETGLSTPPAVGDVDYMQISSRGTGDGLNVMTVTRSEVEQQTREPETGGNWDDIDKLGEDSKGGVPNPIDKTTQQIVVRNDPSDLFWQAGEVAQIVVPPLTAGGTMADAWADRSLVTDWMIDFDSTEMVDAADEDFAVPHAVALMGRFTTLSPLVDNADNDNDGTDDNAEEIFVPGRINLNTVPESVLKTALPVPDDTFRDTLADIIIAYRNRESFGAYTFADPNRALQTGFREAPGFAHLGEVFMAAGGLFLGDGDTSALSGTTIDFLRPDSASPDNIADDREERAFVMRWLSSVATVRSDVFAVYVTVRGYPQGDLTEMPVEAIRFVAILDRSGIEDGDDKVKVLAVMRY